MEDKDVDAVLRLVGLRTSDGELQFDYHRDEIMQRLMILHYNV